jgi:hypothetical protein
MGFGRVEVSSEIRVPNPPARITACIMALLILNLIIKIRLVLPVIALQPDYKIAELY